MELDKEQLIKKIKQKKELSGLTESLVSDALNSYLKKHNISLSSIKNSELKIIIKEIRAELRNLTGRFQKKTKKRSFLLEKKEINALLKTHSSTAERLEFYPRLKEIISSLKINSILDIGCGLNPIALASSKVKYYALDIKEDDLSLVNKFFKENNINGEIIASDIRKLPELPAADLCIIFKTLDIIEKKSHNIAFSLIEKLNFKYLLISFATKTLSGKPMKLARRFWLENFLNSRNYFYETFFSSNEVFYLVRKI